MWEIETRPQDLVEELYYSAAFVQKRRGTKDNDEMSWSNFSLSSGSFEFWDDPREVEYSWKDLKDKS